MDNWHRNTAQGTGKGLAICDAGSVVARVSGNGYPIGIGNDPKSDAVANLIAASPRLLRAAKAFIAELDSAGDFANWERCKAELRASVAEAEAVTFNTRTGWDGAPEQQGN